ncbi:MAG: hypothetical protein K0Q73_6332 [Paenibacillus sp.]|nr:hypothetical protein [Paenibacillus sp.]
MSAVPAIGPSGWKAMVSTVPSKRWRRIYNIRIAVVGNDYFPVEVPVAVDLIEPE